MSEITFIDKCYSDYIFYSCESLHHNIDTRPTMCLYSIMFHCRVINAGKTRVNEDQARAETILIAQGGLDPNLSNGLSPEDESLSEMDKVAKRLRQMGNEPDNADFKSLVSLYFVTS